MDKIGHLWRLIVADIPREQYKAIFSICLVDYFLMMGYSINRPISQSIFLSAFTEKGLPYAWLFVAIVCAAAVAILNKLLNKFDIIRLYSASAAATALIVALITAGHYFPGESLIYKASAFLSFTLKDIYVVILLEQVWSYCNLIFNNKSAAKLYGFFTAIGTIGSLCGNLAVSQLSQVMGSNNLLWGASIGIALSAYIFFSRERGAEKRLSGGGAKLERTEDGGTAILLKSRYLFFMALLVLFMQLVINLLDFQFNGLVKNVIPAEDARSGFFGYFYMSINGLALLIQIVLAPIMLKKLGAMKSLWLAPVLLTVAAIAIIAMPMLTIVAGAMVLAKGLDYSLTRAAKEMLYLPLSFEEKYKAKAVIDMFVYRTAKGVASGLLILLPFITESVALFSGILTLISLGGWFGALIGLKVTEPKSKDAA